MAARDYVGLVLDCTRRKGGDVETFICASYSPHDQRHTLIPTTGRLCRRHEVVLNAGGWDVKTTRRDPTLVKKVLTDLETFVRTSNADPFMLPTTAASAQRNIELLKMLPREPQSQPRAGVLNSLAQFAMYQALIEELSPVGKIVFIELPINDEDSDRSGEYIVLEAGHDRLYCVSTSDAVDGCQVAQIRIVGEPGQQVAKVLRSYKDNAYIDSFIRKLNELAGDTTTARLIRDRAENTAAQLRRMMNRVYPIQVSLPRASEAIFGQFSRAGTQTGRVQSETPNKPNGPTGPSNPFDALLRHSVSECDAFGCNEYQPSDAVLPL